ncbi:DUF5677 domain-containing protein [Paucibacter sp. R3-3]|uniref:DUF5677 domain-containing protein n=1 Tax=Roseateles agri TaxID=3098619 RepID=A0ABU5DD42_9BURK|nr:DUF5677 domain-containing protein [Paucibacter sp. R3-3]MDY0744200.1 DUF5677 domain-containing protein [Paucibacter sp. R3-3]
MLDNVVRECMYVSRSYAGIKSPTSKHFYASVLFTALITRGVSLAQLMPFTPWAEKRIEHWDYASAAGIVRTMLELRVAFYYLCVDSCPDEEWNCRWNLFNLHDCVSRIRLFSAVQNPEQVAAFETHATELRQRLQTNPFFSSLQAGQQRKFLHGQTAYLMPLEDIAEHAGIEKSVFRWIYVLFSSHVHGLPMSFYRIGDRGRGLPSPTEEGYTSLCLSLASTFLVTTRDEVHELFVDFKSQADDWVKSETSIEATSDVPVSGKRLAVGETITLTETGDLAIEVTMLTSDSVESVYRHKPTGSIVLRRTDSDTDGASLDFFDGFYWTVFVNNLPTTQSQVEALDAKAFAFKVDHASRTLHLKVEE